MKKLFVVVFICIGLCFIFGCQNESEPETPSNLTEITDTLAPMNTEPVVYRMIEPTDRSYVFDVANDGSGVAQEVDVWKGSYFDRDAAPKTKTVQALGETYTGTYRHSLNDVYCSYTTDYYETQDGVFFEVRADTGDLVLLNLMTLDFIEQNKNILPSPNAEAYARSYAETVAKDYIDLSEYERMDEAPKYINSIGGYFYTTTFARKIDGLYTSDYIAVRVASTGKLVSISMGDINALKPWKNRTIDKNKIDTVVHAKLTSVYEGLNYEIIDYEIDMDRLAVTPDGALVLVSNVRLNVRKDGNSYATGVRLITELN